MADHADGTIETILQRTVGRWQPCPLWVLRGKMFSLAEKALLIALLDLWHSAGRPQWFFASNQTAGRLAGLSKRAFEQARKRLLTKCILNSKPGKRGRGLATSYHLSQEFLYTLTTTHSLKTSTSSGGLKVGVFQTQDGEEEKYLPSRRFSFS